MKWTILGLLLLGVVAALAVAVLFATLQAQHRPQAMAAALPAEIEILCAATDLPAVAVVDGNAIVTRKIPQAEASLEWITDPVHVVGKVLSAPMKKGEAFTAGCFATKSSVNLAAAVKEGMRAFSLSLPNYGAMEGLLYPGGVVDVLGSFRVPEAGSGREETVSLTLLRAVQVLAVENRTIVSGDSVGNSLTSSSSNNKCMVTLMVTPQQAQLLQLGQEHGTLSLAMRNPLDVARSETGTSSKLSDFLQSRPRPMEATAAPIARATPQPAAAQPQEKPAPQWSVQVIRGAACEIQDFPMPKVR